MPVTEQEASAAIQLLPHSSWLRTYCSHAFYQTTAPMVYNIGVGLTTLGVTCPIHYGMEYAGPLRANNYTLLVGRSGEDNKSSALKVGTRLLQAAAPNLIGEFPGSPEGLVESLEQVPSQMIPMSEFGKFLSSAQRGYFEPIKALLADTWDCLCDKTEILTTRGWLGIGEVTLDDVAISLEPSTDQLVHSRILDVGMRQVRPGERMVVLDDFIRVTEGHRFYIKPGRRVEKAEYRVLTGVQLVAREGVYRLPMAAEPAYMHMPEEEFLEFWYEAASQSNSTDNSIQHASKTVVDFLQKMAVEQGYSTHCTTTRSENGDVIYNVYANGARDGLRDPLRDLDQFEFETPRPNERVWCVTTSTGTIVTRREGKVVILGNCDPVQRAKANKKVVRVPNPRLSIVAACSIPYLEKHTLVEDWTGGFMGRWLVLYGMREREDPDPVGNDTRTEKLVDGLRDRAVRNAGWCRGLDYGAKPMWDEWYINVMQRPLPQNIIGIRARAPTIARKIALVLAWDLLDVEHDWLIPPDVLHPAIAMTELHIKSLIDLSVDLAEHDDARLRRSIIKVILDHQGVATLGEILAVLKLKKRPVIEMLDALIESGLVQKIKTSIDVDSWSYALSSVLSSSSP